MSDDFELERERRAEEQRVRSPPHRGGRESAIGGRGVRPDRRDARGRPASADHPERRKLGRGRHGCARPHPGRCGPGDSSPPRLAEGAAGASPACSPWSCCTSCSRCGRCGRRAASDQARTVDAIVVMGAAQYDGRPSPQLEARLDHVVDLWPEGTRPARRGHRRQPPRRSVHRGRGVGDLPRAKRGSPSRRSCRRARARRRTSRSPGAESLLAARGLDTVLIVTDPYHALRSRMIAEELGLQRLHVADTDLGRHRDERGRTSPRRSGRRRRRPDRSGSTVSTISPIEPPTTQFGTDAGGTIVGRTGSRRRGPSHLGVWCNWQHSSFWYCY